MPIQESAVAQSYLRDMATRVDEWITIRCAPEAERREISSSSRSKAQASGLQRARPLHSQRGCFTKEVFWYCTKIKEYLKNGLWQEKVFSF